MSCRRIRLADAESQGQLVIQAGVRQIEISTSIEQIHQELIRFVSALATKADEIERRRRCQLETIIVSDPTRELLRRFDVTPNVILQTFDAVVPDHEP